VAGGGAQVVKKKKKKKESHAGPQVAHAYNQEAEIRRISVQSQPQANSSGEPITKTHHKKRLSKHEARSSSPSAAKNKTFELCKFFQNKMIFLEGE
jgi:hypothetical protein